MCRKKVPQSGKAKEEVPPQEGTLSNGGKVGLVSNREESAIFTIIASLDTDGCQLGQFLCLGQFPDSTLKWCEICDDHSFGTGMHRYESCKGETCQEVYGQGNGCQVGH